MLSEPLGMAAICYELDTWLKNKGNINIWDVGPGWGKWGLLIREIVASHLAEAGDMKPSLNNILFCGYEMCEYFVENLKNRNLYDYLHTEDFTNLGWWKDPNPDLVIMFDVLEHWTQEQIKSTLDYLFKVFPNTEVLISVPKQVVMYEQAYYGNDCPKHKNNLRMEDYEKIFPQLNVTPVPCEHKVHSDIFWLRSKT